MNFNSKKAGATIVETAITFGWFLIILICCFDLIRYGYYNAIAQTAMQNTLEIAELNPVIFSSEDIETRHNKRAEARDLLIRNIMRAQGMNFDDVKNFEDENNDIFFALKHIPAGTNLATNGGCSEIAKFKIDPKTEPDEVTRPLLIACVQYPIRIFLGTVSAKISAYAIGRSE